MVPSEHPVLNRVEGSLSPFVLFIVWVVGFQLLFFSYSTALPGIFVYDDYGGIVSNEDMHHPGELSRFFGDHDSSLEFDRRPVTGISMALNHALSGLEPGAFRITNMLVHWLNAIFLFLLLSKLAQHFNCREPKIYALLVSLLWLLHPLCTGTISYIYQRSEALMATFFLLSLLCFMKADASRKWLVLTFICAVLSALSKEVGLTVTASLILLDWLVLSGDIRQSFSRRWPFYLSLLAVQIIISWWIWSGVRMTELDMGTGLATSWGYFKYQCGVLLHYLKLVFWPAPLLLMSHAGEVPPTSVWLPQCLLLVLLFSWLLYTGKNHRWLWLGLGTVLAILAPTSSFLHIPLEPEAEFRMYLPSAVILAMLAAGLFRLLTGKARVIGAAVGVFLILAAMFATRHRNHDFATTENLWASVLKHQPWNVKAWQNLGIHHLSEGQFDEALLCSRRLMDLKNQPGGSAAFLTGRYMSAQVALETGNAEAALAELRDLSQFEDDLKGIGIQVALACIRTGNLDEAETRIVKLDERVGERNYDLHALRAELWISQGKLSQSKEVIDRLEKIAPTSYRVKQLRHLHKTRHDLEENRGKRRNSP